MNKEEKKMIKSDIHFIKRQNIEELYLVKWYAVKSMINAIIVFSYNHPVVRENRQISHDFRKIIEEEMLYLNIAEQNLDIIDVQALNDFFDELDEVNEATLKYYYHCIDNIEDATSMRELYRAKRPRKDFDTIIETDRYRKELCGLLLNEEEVYGYAKFGEEFYKYIHSHMKQVNDETWYGVYPIVKDSIVVDIKIFAPKITNLQTASIYIREMKYASDIFKLLGKPYIEQDYEKSARELEHQLKTEYMKQKVKSVFL